MERIGILGIRGLIMAVLTLGLPSLAHAAGQTDYILLSDRACERAHGFRQFGSRVERCGGPIGLRQEYYLCRTTPALVPEPKNLALNIARKGFPRPSASSTFAGYDLWAPLDGSNDSWSNASSDGDRSTWDLDFGKPTRVGKVIVKTWKDYALKDFDLLRWDEDRRDWDADHPIARIRRNRSELITIPHLNLTTRKLRMLCLSGPDHQAIFRRITEFQVFAPPAPTPRFEPRWFSYQVKIPTTGRWTLEVQEVNDDRHNGDRTRYRILVDGKPVYLRDYADEGPGLITYFFDLPATGKPAATVTFKDTSGYGMRIRSIRAYADFETYCRQNRFMVPMTICQRALSFDPDKGLRTDLMERWLKVFEAEGARDKIGFVGDFAYLQRGPDYVRQLTDALGKLMVERNIPLVLGYTTWWSFSPLNTPDGMGGTFRDIQYQQIGYSKYDSYHDPGLKEYMDSCKPGWYDVHYGLTIPNHWSSVPWLTMNNKRLNAARQRGLALSIAELNRWLAEMERRGQAGNLLGIIGDDEPVYWTKIVDVFPDGYGRVNGGVPRTDLLLDFNWSVIQDAARDGVKLDPTDGLDEREKHWLHLNPARYNRMIMSTIRQHLRKPAIRVKGDGFSWVRDDPGENLFVYITGGKGYPLEDRFHPIWETEVFPEAGVGLGKGLSDYLRGRELGRVANSDFECDGSTSERVRSWLPLIRGFYEAGARFTHHTNPGDPENWAPVARLMAHPTPEMERKRLESLLIIWRRNAEDRIREQAGATGLRASMLREARKLLYEGRYRDAFERALTAKSLALPARYRVDGQGALQPYPIAIHGAKASVEIFLRGTGNRLALDTDSESPFRIAVRGLPPNARLKLRPTDRIAGTSLRAGRDGTTEVTVPAGHYSLEIE